MAFRSMMVPERPTAQRKPPVRKEMPRHIQTAFEVWFNAPAGLTIMDLATLLLKTYPDQYENYATPRALSREMENWRRKYDWDVGLTINTIGARTERLRLLVKLGTSYYNLVEDDIEQGQTPDPKTVGALLNVFDCIDKLADQVDPNGQRDGKTFTVEHIIKGVAGNQGHQVLTLPPGSYHESTG